MDMGLNKKVNFHKNGNLRILILGFFCGYFVTVVWEATYRGRLISIWSSLIVFSFQTVISLNWNENVN